VLVGIANKSFVQKVFFSFILTLIFRSSLRSISLAETVQRKGRTINSAEYRNSTFHRNVHIYIHKYIVFIYFFLFLGAFICPYIASISLKYNQQGATFSRSTYFYKLLYMLQAVPPPIIRSTKLYIQRQILSKPYCCLLLSWMRWN
jgi:hypothetical protein